MKIEKVGEEMVMIKQMLVLFTMMMIGWLAYRQKIITTSSHKTLSELVVKIANPALILSAAVGGYEQIEGKTLLVTVAVAVILYLVLILMASLMPHCLKVSAGESGPYKVMTLFSNIGFMCFPVISALYGGEALLYASIFLLPYNLLIYTYGIRQLSKEKQSLHWGQIFNMGVIASLLAILLFAFKIEITGPLGDSIIMLSQLTAPLSMIVIGASFGEMQLRALVADRRLMAFTLLRQFVLPLLLGVVVVQLVPDQLIANITLIMLAAPVGSMCALLAQTYEGDYELVSKGVVLSTLLSLISIPLVTLLLT